MNLWTTLLSFNKTSMNISASILAVEKDFVQYAHLLENVHADCIHVDVFQDGRKFPLERISEFNRVKLPLDVHLIYETISENDIALLNRAGTRFLNVQYENLADKSSIRGIASDFNGNFGIAITVKTPVDVIDEYVDILSQVLFMCSEPGVSGAGFDEKNFERIKNVHERYPSLNLFADGGINDCIAGEMEQLGVSQVVSGSYLCKDLDNIANRLYSLRYVGERHIAVTRLMVKKMFLPVCPVHASVLQILCTMNQYRLGAVFILNEEEFAGIITDGDIRRGFLKWGNNMLEKSAGDLMNSSPFCIGQDTTMEELYRELSLRHKGIDVVPVVGSSGLLGAIDLHIGL